MAKFQCWLALSLSFGVALAETTAQRASYKEWQVWMVHYGFGAIKSSLHRLAHLRLNFLSDLSILYKLKASERERESEQWLREMVEMDQKKEEEKLVGFGLKFLQRWLSKLTGLRGFPWKLVGVATLVILCWLVWPKRRERRWRQLLTIDIA